MDKILDILKLKKIDKFLILHYPIIWKFRLLYLLPFLIGYTVFIYIIPFDFIMYIWSFILLLVIFIGFIMIIFYDSFLLKIKLSGLKEYFLYLFIYILLIMPFSITLQSNKYFFDKNQEVYNYKYSISRFKIENYKCVYKTPLTDKTRELNKEENEFITTVIQTFSDKNLTKLSKEDFNQIVENYNKVAIFGMIKNNFKEIIIILLMLPFLSIFLIYVSETPIILKMQLMGGIFALPLMMTKSFFEKFDSVFIIKSIEYMSDMNIVGIGILFLIATIFTYWYKIKLNILTAWLVLLGLILYFSIFIFYIHLGILYSGLLVVLNMLFIISSLKEKLIILDARPRK